MMESLTDFQAKWLQPLFFTGIIARYGDDQPLFLTVLFSLARNPTAEAVRKDGELIFFRSCELTGFHHNEEKIFFSEG